MSKEIKFNVRLNVDGKEQLVTAATSIEEIKCAVEATKSSTDKLRDSLINFSQVSVSMQNVISGLQQLTGVLREYSAANAVQVEVETKLATVMRQRMEASEADIAAIKQLASAQQELGVIGDEVQLAGAQQIATFLNQRSSLEALIPAMNDLLAQQKGLKATGEDAVTVANLMGKAMQGQASALRRVGITFTAAQEQVLKYGDESQRAAMLAEVITDNVGHMNSELAKTDAGKAQQMANTIGDMKEVVGSLFESIEPTIAAVSELGMAFMGIGSMVTGIKSVKAALVLFTSKLNAATIATYANAAASKVAAAAQFLWAKQLHYGRKANIAWAFSARLAATQAVAMRAAILGLMAASGVGLALMAVSAIVSLFSDKTDEATESMKAANREMANAEEAAKRLEDMERAMSEARAGAVSSLELYKERLKNLIAMKNTGKDTTKEEKKIIGELNDTYGETMGYFDSVSKWYDALIKNSEAYCRQMVIEARMRQLANQIAEKEAENHSIIYDDKGNKRRYSKKRETEIIDEWGVDRDGNRVLAKREVKEKKGSSDLDKAVQKLKDNSAVIKNLQSQMSASAKEAGQIVIPVKGSSVRPGTGGHATPKAAPQLTKAAPAAEGSMDWYEQRLAELRKQLHAAADEETARALQADYKATEQEYADLKVSIGVEAPDKAETDTALDKLRDELRAAQRELDDAVTVEAKVEASAKADDIQARIDEATRGQLTIGADVEPSYIAKGSAADLRQSYQNAQARATRIQQDYEIGLIDKDKALADIAEINLALEKLGDNGMKPIEIGVMGEDADKAGESLQEATAAIGSMGQALSGLGGAIEMPELNIAGTVAQAVATMALGYAKATSEAGKASPWEWVAFAATGLAQLTAMIASVRQATAFATGGIVGGGSPSGDRKFVRVNSGEMILNKTQQARLFGLVSGSLRCLPSAEVRPTVAMGDISGIVEPAVTNVNVSLGLDARKMVRVIHETKTVAGKSGRKYS